MEFYEQLQNVGFWYLLAFLVVHTFGRWLANRGDQFAADVATEGEVEAGRSAIVDGEQPQVVELLPIPGDDGGGS